MELLKLIKHFKFKLKHKTLLNIILTKELLFKFNQECKILFMKLELSLNHML